MSVLNQAKVVNHFKIISFSWSLALDKLKICSFLPQLASLRASAPDNIGIHIALSDQIDGHELPDAINDLPVHQGFCS